MNGCVMVLCCVAFVPLQLHPPCCVLCSERDPPVSLLWLLSVVMKHVCWVTIGCLRAHYRELPNLFTALMNYSDCSHPRLFIQRLFNDPMF